MFMKKLFFFMILFSLFRISASEGVFVYVEGEVEISVSGDGGFIPATAGMAILPGAVICTGFDGTAEIDITTGILVAEPLTRMTLEELAIHETQSKARTRLTLDSGGVAASVDSSRWDENDFEIQTPVTTASVRGTEFVLTPRTLTCTEGRVSYSGRANNKRSVAVGAGQQAVNTTNALQRPQTVKAKKINLKASSPMAFAYGASGGGASQGNLDKTKNNRRTPWQSERQRRLGSVSIEVR